MNQYLNSMAALSLFAASNACAQSGIQSPETEPRHWLCPAGSTPEECEDLRKELANCDPADDASRCSVHYELSTERCGEGSHGKGCDMVYLPDICKTKPDLPQCKSSTVYLPDICKTNPDLPQCKKPDVMAP